MKNPIKLYIVIVSMLIVALPFNMAGQEKEKKVRIKTVKVIDGKEVVTDTTYTLSGDEDFDEVINKFNTTSDTSAEKVTVKVFVESDADGQSEEKVFVIQSGADKQVKVIQGQGGAQAFTYTIEDDDNDGKKVIILTTGPGDKKVMKWKSDEDGEVIFDMDEEYKIVMKDLERELEGISEMCVELKGISELENADFMKKMIELEAIVGPDGEIIADPHSPHHAMFFEGHHGGNRVSDRELRDAGIKNKADRLETDEMNIDIDNGVVDLSFTLKTVGAPKVVVYNFFGEKVFTGKPELMNGKYEIKMDLSAKQHGVYYLQVIQKNSSFTEKLRL